MRGKLDYKVIARYLSNSCTDQEKAEVEQWVESDIQNRQMMKEFRSIWDAAGKDEYMKEAWTDIEEDWKLVEERAGLNTDFASRSTGKKSFQYNQKRTLQQFVKVAAIFLVMAMMGILIYQNWQEPEPVAQSPVLREISTSNGERVNLTLSDGTHMLVNSGSMIRLPNTFQPNKREVFLEGEAYFNVTENPDSPFIIHSQNVTTEVLGTSFTVRSYPEDGRVRVVVEQGRVSFGTEQAGPSDRVTLSGNEMASYHFTQKKLESRQVDDMDLYMSWTEGYLKFSDKPMRDVAKELERRYDIRVEFENSGIEEMRLTANLKSRSMRNVLEVIAMSLDIDYRIEEEETVIFSKN